MKRTVAGSVLAALLGLLAAGSANAQATTGVSATVMWGTQSGTPGSAFYESAAGHIANGVVAGQANAAKMGSLINTGPNSNMTVYSVGVQNVATTNIAGSNNNVNANQNGTNTGAVTNNGGIQIKP